jgi:hypothetical protein
MVCKHIAINLRNVFKKGGGAGSELHQTYEVGISIFPKVTEKCLKRKNLNLPERELNISICSLVQEASVKDSCRLTPMISTMTSVLQAT